MGEELKDNNFTDLKNGDAVTVRFMRHYKGSHFTRILKTGTFIKMINETECLVQIKGNKNVSRVLERRVWETDKWKK